MSSCKVPHIFQIWNFFTDIHKGPNINSHRNPYNEGRADKDGRTDGPDEAHRPFAITVEDKEKYVRKYKNSRQLSTSGPFTLPLPLHFKSKLPFNPLKPELNSICYLLALLGAHHFLHVSRIRVKLLTFRLLMSYIYGAPILDVSRSHTTTQYSR